MNKTSKNPLPESRSGFNSRTGLGRRKEEVDINTVGRPQMVFGTSDVNPGLLVITKKEQPTFSGIFRGFHECPNETCLALWFIAHVTGFSLEEAEWPTCLICKKCLVEPGRWRVPLRPIGCLLCATCINENMGLNHGGFFSEAHARQYWLLKEFAASRSADDVRTYPGDALARRPYTGSKGDAFAKIKAAVTVEAVAGRFTDLRPAGPGKLKGCCPLHQEVTASFHIWTEKGTWRCFGACARGGDVIALTGLLLNLQPNAVLTHLAQEFNVGIPRNRNRRRARRIQVEVRV